MLETTKKFRDGMYWLELKYVVSTHKRRWYWIIMACNGRIKCSTPNLYGKRSLAVNDAKAFADYVGLKVRES